MSKIVDLNQKKTKLKIKDELEQIGLDMEMVNEYDKSSLRNISKDLMVEFFNQREEVSNQFNIWLNEQIKDQKDLTAIWSVVCEHFQNLLLPDINDIHDLFMSTKSIEDAEKGEKDLEKWLTVAGELENFQLMSMKTYLVGNIKNE